MIHGEALTERGPDTEPGEAIQPLRASGSFFLCKTPFIDPKACPAGLFRDYMKIVLIKSQTVAGT